MSESTEPFSRLVLILLQLYPRLYLCLNLLYFDVLHLMFNVDKRNVDVWNLVRSAILMVPGLSVFPSQTDLTVRYRTAQRSTLHP